MKKGWIAGRDTVAKAVGIFLALVLLFSCAAQFISSDGARIKVTNITLDMRGAALTADMYYPKGASAEKLH